jgi:hypothetical protein
VSALEIVGLHRVSARQVGPRQALPLQPEGADTAVLGQLLARRKIHLARDARRDWVESPHGCIAFRLRGQYRSGDLLLFDEAVEVAGIAGLWRVRVAVAPERRCTLPSVSDCTGACNLPLPSGPFKNADMTMQPKLCPIKWKRTS